jgi:hypothetical protein
MSLDALYVRNHAAYAAFACTKKLANLERRPLWTNHCARRHNPDPESRRERRRRRHGRTCTHVRRTARKHGVCDTCLRVVRYPSCVVRTGDAKVPHVGFFALRDIEPNEELAYLREGTEPTRASWRVCNWCAAAADRPPPLACARASVRRAHPQA